MSVLRRRSLSLGVAFAALVGGAIFVQSGATASAVTQSVTYSATITIPVPPASSYAGTGGGDGWAVALSSTAVYNVFHHNSVLNVACHLQKDASACWSPAYKTITDNSGKHFATPGQPGVWLDQANGHLFVFATHVLNKTAGVVCMDTTKSGAYCGFTPLTPTGSTPTNGSYSGITNPVTVGSKTYAFNSVSNSTATGAKNRLLCFDQVTRAACAGQPFNIKIGAGTVTSSSSPSPGIAAIGNEIIVPLSVAGAPIFACYNPTAGGGTCAGSWPRSAPAGYVNSHGAPFPMLSKAGGVTGFCLPSGNDECFNLNGSSVATPSGMKTAITSSYNWNGTAVVIGPRVYVPSGQGNKVGCYDYSAVAGCAQFPKTFSNLYLLYTVNPDPYRADCLWVNSDSGTQIQNFDAFNPSQACGEGPIRVLASSVVVDTPLCTPATYTSMQVTDPPRNSYKSGSVHFADTSANPIPGIPDKQLDATGAISLEGLKLNTSSGLPQFLVTLNGAGSRPKSVTVKLTWTATYDPSCVKAGTLATPITAPVTTTTVAVAATPTTVAAPAELPRTGSSSAPMAAVGIVTMLAGAALLTAARRRRPHSA